MKPKSGSRPEATVRAIYRKLSRTWGRQHWWPAETPFEVIVGAILTQNTSWTNVERAMANLRSEELLTQNGIGPETADSILLYAGNHEAFVVDAYTRRLLERHQAVSANAKYDEVRNLIQRALQREQPVESHRPRQQARPQVHEASAMSTAQRSPLAQVYNEMHGLLVQVGKHHCLKQQPKCEICPLGSMLPISIEQSDASRKIRKRSPGCLQPSAIKNARKADRKSTR